MKYSELVDKIINGEIKLPKSIDDKVWNYTTLAPVFEELNGKEIVYAEWGVGLKAYFVRIENIEITPDILSYDAVIIAELHPESRKKRDKVRLSGTWGVPLCISAFGILNTIVGSFIFLDDRAAKTVRHHLANNDKETAYEFIQDVYSFEYERYYASAKSVRKILQNIWQEIRNFFVRNYFLIILFVFIIFLSYWFSNNRP
ncbi:MAG: hypothetical protein LBS69_03160, partial [Prevotellaceae bacterium]|nr:hypothetical protein [Prevotellaceae bacterium]